MSIDPADLRDVLELARREVAKAATRVKGDDKSTLHPIVEGVVQVVEAVASDRHAILTISVLDPGSGLYYSLPCSVGRNGVVEIHSEVLQDPSIEGALDVCRRGMLATLRAAGETC